MGLLIVAIVALAVEWALRLATAEDKDHRQDDEQGFYD